MHEGFEQHLSMESPVVAAYCQICTNMPMGNVHWRPSLFPSGRGAHHLHLYCRS